MISLSFAPALSKSKAAASGIALFVADDKRLPASDVLAPHARFLNHALANSGFTGKKGETLSLVNPESSPTYYLVIGLGAARSVKEIHIEEAGGHALAAALAAKLAGLDIVAALPKGVRAEAADAAARIGFGAQLRSYRFDKYKTKEKEEDKPKLARVAIVTPASAKAQKLAEKFTVLAESIAFTRDLVSEPANVLYPESFAAECRKLSKLGVKVEVLGVAELKKLGMHMLLGVGQGSVKDSQVVVMQYYGGRKGAKPVALVGKGVCFDTGGISIKPANGMEEMKFDMGGAATVTGTIRALAARHAKVNVIGVIGLVENMPDGNAQRPGDVVTSMSGQTVEVLNTDAEGRLVLGDCLWYAVERFQPQCIVDLATLTGAILVALGSTTAGLFSNNDKLCAELNRASAHTQEKIWRLPMGPEFDEMINSDIADIQNISNGREAGSITAAQFLQRFIKDETPWAHLDIAGTAWTKKATALTPKGAVGWGVRLLTEWLENDHKAA
ncbi:MAG: leucyl aminopeptidase [Alphaproteobacteria bacterium]